MLGNTMGKKEEIIQLDIKVRLPGSIAREAEARGLLKPESLETLLRESAAVERRPRPLRRRLQVSR
jgi:hypothetical protein